MAKVKLNITITEDQKAKAIVSSKEIFGAKNISAYVGYLIEEDYKKKKLKSI